MLNSNKYTTSNICISHSSSVTSDLVHWFHNNPSTHASHKRYLCHPLSVYLFMHTVYQYVHKSTHPIDHTYSPRRDQEQKPASPAISLCQHRDTTLAFVNTSSSWQERHACNSRKLGISSLALVLWDSRQRLWSKSRRREQGEIQRLGLFPL